MLSNVFLSRITIEQQLSAVVESGAVWRLNPQEVKSMVSLCGCVAEKMGRITLACAII